MSRGVPSVLVVLLASSLLGCGEPAESAGAGLLETGASAGKQLAEKASSNLSPQGQAELQRREEELRLRLDDEYTRAASAQDRAVALATFIDRRLSEADRTQASLARLQEILAKAEAGDGSSVDNAKTNLAVALRQIAMQQEAVAKPIGEEPVVAEAVRRVTAARAADPAGPRQQVGQIAAGLAFEPCAFTSPGQAGSGRFAIANVALGMTKQEVFGALCAEGARPVRQLPAGQSTADDRYDPLRKVGFEATTVRLKELPWTMAPEWPASATLPTARSTANRTFSDVQFCFSCAPSAPGERPSLKAANADGLFLRFSPEGRVVYILRTQKFERPDKIDLGNGHFNDTMAFAPKPWSEVLAPLEKQFGSPSLLATADPVVNVAWVYPDRSNVLPLETWTFDGKVFSLNGVGPIRADGGGQASLESEALLRSQTPRASFCATSHGEGLGGNLGSAVGLHPGVDDALPPRPGYIERCGVLVEAGVERAKPLTAASERRSLENLSMPKPQTPVYSTRVSITDTDAYRAEFVRREREARTIPGGAPVVSQEVMDAARRPKPGEVSAKALDDYKVCLYSRAKREFNCLDEQRCASLEPHGRPAKACLSNGDYAR